MKRLCMYAYMAVISLSFVLLFIGCSKRPPEHTLVTAKEGFIKIPVNEISDGRVHFYTYRKSGERINFIVRMDGSGLLSACYDACLTCYKHKKGYREEGTDLICNECSMKFGIADEKWDNSQGCSPIMLKSQVDKDYLTIKAADIERGKKLFQ